MENENKDLSEVRRSRTVTLEVNGINQIAEEERHGEPKQLFWPWLAANVGILGVSQGAFMVSFGLSGFQLFIAMIVGLFSSYLICAFIAIAGKRASAPTLTISRSIFGVRGNRLPSSISWLLMLGWEISLVTVAVLATATVLGRLGWESGIFTKIATLAVLVGIIVWAGALGYDLIMRVQRWITWITGILTITVVLFGISSIDFSSMPNPAPANIPAVVGAILITMSGFGLGWVNAAADYSRYLPRSASSAGVVWWTVFGSVLGPTVLVSFGILLALSSSSLSSDIMTDPVGALTTVIPTWFLIPFVIVTVLGLTGGAIMGMYSSGLSLMNAGVDLPRWVAVCIDAVLMVIASVYMIFFAENFRVPFQGFLITLGVPIAAWCGIFVADILLRKRDYDEKDLFLPNGRYGDVRVVPITLMAAATFIGWGSVTNNMAGWLSWQGYLLGPLGLEGEWANANLGVLFALLIGFFGYLLLERKTVAAQEHISGQYSTNSELIEHVEGAL